MRLEHVSVRTSDMDRSVAFYTELLGMTFVRSKEIPQWNAAVAFLASDNGNLLELLWYRDQTRFEVPQLEAAVFDHLSFAVEDVDAVIEECRKRDVPILDEPFRLAPGGSKLAFILDPDGTRIELIERAP